MIAWPTTNPASHCDPELDPPGRSSNPPRGGRLLGGGAVEGLEALQSEKRAELASQSSYITRRGFERLSAELEWLWKEERPRVTEAVATAAALGDRSENADYIYGKKRLREIDRRIRFLTKRLDELTVVEGGPRKDPDKVYFAAWVHLEDEAGEEQRYQLVGPDEFDAKQGRISVDSPVGRALMGKRVGDEVLVRRPRGETVYTILGIDYDGTEPDEGGSPNRV
jgi:transcription elongation factor GreB